MTGRSECRYYGRDFTAEEMALLRALTDVGAAGFALLAWEDPNGADGALSPICAWGRRSTACWWRCWPRRGCRSGV